MGTSRVVTSSGSPTIANHSATASTSDPSFQPKLWVISRHILLGLRLNLIPPPVRDRFHLPHASRGVLGQSLPHPVERNIRLQIAAPGDRHLPGFLGYHYRQSVGLFGNSDGRAMAGAQPSLHHRIGGERKKAGGRRDAIALDDDGAVMQRPTLVKDGAQEIP